MGNMINELIHLSMGDFTHKTSKLLCMAMHGLIGKREWENMGSDIYWIESV